MMSTGSRGVGIRISKGTFVTLEERFDERIVTVMDGKEQECPITAVAIRGITGRGFDVTIENQLPVSQGFGMSASGAIASALCASSFEEKGIEDAFISAHKAEITGGGGLGDVSALCVPYHVPVRARAGLPPVGQVVDSGLSFERLSLIVLDGPLNTGSALSDPVLSKRIAEKGSMSVDMFLEKGDKDTLFSLSREFSAYIGLETQSMKNMMKRVERSGMCMLGHSLFAEEETDAEHIECSSTDVMPFICRE